MNCPNCKNPNTELASDCEWCGLSLNINSSNINFDYHFMINFLLKKNYTNPKPIMIFVDNVMVKEFSIKEGCDFDYITSNNKPNISVSFDGKKLYKLPDVFFDSNSRKIRIDWRSNWLGVIHFDKPSIYNIS
jgi:hypothetical protein